MHITMCLWYREIYFKELTHVVGGAGQSGTVGQVGRREAQEGVSVAV